jgi:hypothetical protein
MTASMMSPSGVMFLKRWMSRAFMLSIMATLFVVVYNGNKVLVLF